MLLYLFLGLMEDCGVVFAYFNSHRFLGSGVLAFGNIAKATFSKECLDPVGGAQQDVCECPKVIFGKHRKEGVNHINSQTHLMCGVQIHFSGFF